jgi:hypothetical protein
VRNSVLILGLVLVTSTLVVSGCAGGQNSEPSTSHQAAAQTVSKVAATETSAAPKRSEVSVGNGEANWIITDGATRDGATFVFPEVQINGNGWLVMHPFEEGKPNGDLYVGATYVSSGNNNNVAITVNDEPATGDMFIVMLHRDVDEDQQFDFVFVGDTGQVEDKAVFEGKTMIGHPYPAPKSST